MIDVKMNEGNAEHCVMEGTTVTLLAEFTALLSTVYRNVLENAMTDTDITSPKPVIHKQIRNLFIRALTQGIFLVDREIIDMYVNDKESNEFLMSEFMKAVMGEKDDSKNN